MKRRAKLFLLLTFVLALGVVDGGVLLKIQQNAGVPFPGAVVILDDASWRGRENQDGYYNSYLWSTSNTVLYSHTVAGGHRAILRRVSFDDIASPSKILPILMQGDQAIDSLSPDSSILCLREFIDSTTNRFIIVRTDGAGKPVRVVSPVSEYKWSPNSKSLYGAVGYLGDSLVHCCEASTGIVTSTVLKIPNWLSVVSVTPESKLFGFNHSVWQKSGGLIAIWTVTTIQGKNAVATEYRKRVSSSDCTLYLSPDGKRILWRIKRREVRWLDRLRQKMFRQKVVSNEVCHWEITDVDGKNARDIGVGSTEPVEFCELSPQWTPDSKGVHFVHEGRLMYLAVP